MHARPAAPGSPTCMVCTLGPRRKGAMTAEAGRRPGATTEPGPSCASKRGAMSDHGRKDWSASFTEELAETHGQRPGEAVVERPLVGLAISGGGIRSATFALGVLESLKRARLLARFDYLSTVSGGGYIGAWLSANCRARSPSWLDPDADWSDSIAHLRRYSNYLSPHGRVLQRRHMVDGDDLAAQHAAHSDHRHPGDRLRAAAAAAAVRAVPALAAAGELRWITIVLFILGVVGIAGNQLAADHRPRRSRCLLAHGLWPARALPAAACSRWPAWVYGSATGFRSVPTRRRRSTTRSAVPIAALLALAGVRAAAAWSCARRRRSVADADRAAQVNYTRAGSRRWSSSR